MKQNTAGTLALMKELPHAFGDLRIILISGVKQVETSMIKQEEQFIVLVQLNSAMILTKSTQQRHFKNTTVAKVVKKITRPVRHPTAVHVVHNSTALGPRLRQVIPVHVTTTYLLDFRLPLRCN
jgi:hypothetical protein